MRTLGIIVLVFGHLATGVAIALYAFTVGCLGTAWWASTGVWVGLSLARELRRRALSVPLAFSLILLATVIGRSLPIHSLVVGRVDKIQITRLGEDWQIILTDREEIDAFVAYLQNGSYRSMVKSGYGYHVDLTQLHPHGLTRTGYYIHGDAVGSSPGGLSQSIFVPRKAGFREHFEQILERHGAPAR